MKLSGRGNEDFILPWVTSFLCDNAVITVAVLRDTYRTFPVQEHEWLHSDWCVVLGYFHYPVYSDFNKYQHMGWKLLKKMHRYEIKYTLHI